MSMFRVALKSILGRKGRLVLSALGVIASCTFLSGVFVFNDTISASFNRIFASAYKNTDAVVRSSNEIEQDFGDSQRDDIDASVLTTVAAVPGVKDADGIVNGSAVIANAEGKIIGIDGPPKLGGAFTDSSVTPWKVVEGGGPTGPTEVVIDRRTSKDGSIALGDSVTITTTTGAPRDFTVVGIATFAGNDTAGASTWALFDLPTAQEFVLGKPDKLSAIAVSGDGSVSETELKTRIQTALATVGSTEVLTGAEITEESQSALAEGLSFFTTILTVFAGIAVFVGCFIIYNVFKISAAQRLKENALMRAIGARSGQVVQAQMLEALAVGVLGGLLGFVAGLGLASVILAGLSAAGFGPSDSALTVEPMSFVLTFVIGVIVTLICAVFPALRAGRVPPLAAMRDVSIDRSGRSRRRAIVGGISIVVAVIGLVAGLGGNTLALVPAVIGLFVAVIAFGPLVVGPLATSLTRPLRAVRGVTGEMAARNAARSPERTALTAAALGICLSLLVGVATLGSSVTQSFRNTLGEQFQGDISVSSSQEGSLPTTVLDEMLALPAVDNAVAFGAGYLRSGGDTSKGLGLLTVNRDGAESLITVKFTAGGWDQLQGSNVIVSVDKAESKGYSLGSTIDAAYLNGTPVTLTVVGIFDSDFLGGIVADRSLMTDSGTPFFENTILAAGASGVSTENLKSAVKTVTNDYPTAKTQTRGEFIDSQIAQLGGFLNFIYALLMMSVFIAVLGIVLTLLLSVYERRRELGLVRAIGMTRRQVRSSVRWESIVTALLGAAMGVGVGIALGWIVVQALEDQGLNTFSLSPAAVVGFTLMAIVFAVVAAWWPARKAAKADILQAIATT
jgi:putative ABC transport system permease protein